MVSTQVVLGDWRLDIDIDVVCWLFKYEFRNINDFDIN